MQGWVTNLTLGPDFVQSVGDALQTIGPGPFAVRSSMVGEDSAEHSFAGQLDSFLFQKTPEDVSRSLRACWASAESDAVKTRIAANRMRRFIETSSIGIVCIHYKLLPGR